MQHDCLAAVRPYSDGRSLSVAVALELFQAIGTLWLLALDDDEGRVGVVLVRNYYVGGLLVDGGPELDRLFDSNALRRVAVVVHQHLDVKLPNDLFGLGRTLLTAGVAGEIWLAILQKDRQSGDCLPFEDSQHVGRTTQNIFDSHRGAVVLVLCLLAHSIALPFVVVSAQLTIIGLTQHKTGIFGFLFIIVFLEPC